MERHGRRRPRNSSGPFSALVGTLESDTYEEAPSSLRNWFGQRRRWLKGWFQTLVVHTRDPNRLVRELGVARAWAAQTLLLGAVLGGLFGPALFTYALWRCLDGRLLTAQTSLGAVGNILTLVLMLGGIGAILTPIVLALRIRGLERLYLVLPLLPLYYFLVSLAAWAALIELARRPFQWTKTEHGLSRTPAPVLHNIAD